ncbi:4-(cytidine 5'-diphospho)-2-C-methyl-D-erythritol kinase [Aliidiomarina sanyensis]|uniref:4-diphosphocytidyl-2-C-methyl-D-erythritol kinase n=1 Tax=Aliidiomarina sanyensis TaxID=1249555 RepID=A0A432WEN9_9GAMM|nr:4-(cytidine 5'-diphospho)-2-C-methyl-D-erythritol kinase [Aliidiomarina sanyensis]RUO31357.1 4-(cytidine 5'-diphospho)-2-C-methyl-D-erythritol kinase [Aliidiomarina sanyensis]
MTRLTLPAPAKLNLFLHITGRRKDGYHELETLFQFLTLADQLHFQLVAEDVIRVSPSLPGVALQDHLVFRAAQLLAPYRSDARGIQIEIEKNLPMGGGVGGGSSDAATTLLALNYLWELNLSLEQLAILGLKLGADVPIFVYGAASFAQGVGEKLTPVTPPENWYLLVHPGVHISTAAVFSHPELPRNTPKLTANDPITDWQIHHNDCESLVCSLYPQVATAREWLLKYGPSRLTGTGACLFTCFSSENEARQALHALPSTFRGFLARGVNRSPAHVALAALTEASTGA